MRDGLAAEFRAAMRGLEAAMGSAAEAARRAGVTPQLWASWKRGGEPGITLADQVIVAWRVESYRTSHPEVWHG